MIEAIAMSVMLSMMFPFVVTVIVQSLESCLTRVAAAM
jgi:hypothetical protein